MNWLSQAVAWSALIACVLSISNEIRGRRTRAEERQRTHDAELEAHRADVEAAFARGQASRDGELARIEHERDLWRDRYLDRVNGGGL